jgi:hypothetical protein
LATLEDVCFDLIVLILRPFLRHKKFQQKDGKCSAHARKLAGNACGVANNFCIEDHAAREQLEGAPVCPASNLLRMDARSKILFACLIGVIVGCIAIPTADALEPPPQTPTDVVDFSNSPVPEEFVRMLPCLSLVAAIRF